MIEQSFQVEKKKIANRVVLQPMEGCDCDPDGSPSELTTEKYRKAARSGAGLVWFEANAVCPEGRTNPRQMMLTEENLPSFQKLLKEMREIAEKECGIAPIFILQLTHSGRQSIVPMIAYRHPIYEERRPVTDDHIVTDDYLDTLPEKYVHSALLAVEAGFDGVDVKSCHGYLFQELLSAFTRAGRYGGCFENRTRLYLDCVRAVKKVLPPHILLTTRLSVSDMVQKPYGFGTTEANALDFTEPDMLIGRLVTEGVLSPEDNAPPADDSLTLTVTLDAITPVTSGGETALYLRGVDANGDTLLFKASVAENETVLFLSVGDTVTFTAVATDTAGIYTVIAHEKQ
jgi:2,4-dienoyl-CoA reductase-like NADH-dependent reductase (Old Yellow Enzyme family)